MLWLYERDDVDATRIAIYGRSYGGFMVLAALTEYPELFAAGIDVVGIANWVTFLERTSAWRRAHREREYGSLARHRDLLEQISPIHRAERIQMPLLVLAGDNDPRVPLYESEQVVERVRAAGGSVEITNLNGLMISLSISLSLSLSPSRTQVEYCMHLQGPVHSKAHLGTRSLHQLTA